MTAKNKNRWFDIGIALFTCLILSACGLSQAELDATDTQVAANSFATQTAQAPTAISPLISPEVVAEIDDLLDKLAEQDLFTGSVLLAHQGKVLISQGYGLADREQNIPNTPQTRYRIASMTKQFTAMAILILEAQGKLDVKDPICIYIADCPSTWEAITIHHLLTHTSGIPDYLSLPYYGSSRATPSAPLQTIARFKDLLLNFQPGEKFSYSNSGYIVLGYIIEQVSGQTYQDFLQQSIFTPLNLRDSGYDHNSNGLAIGYEDKYSSLPVDFIDMSIPYAAGALYSTVEDLYRWDQALYTEKLVPQAYLDEMFTPYAVYPDSSGYAYGYGWGIGTDHGRPINGHEGSVEGFNTIIARYPDDQITIIVLSNQQNQAARSILDILTSKIFGDK